MTEPYQPILRRPRCRAARIPDGNSPVRVSINRQLNRNAELYAVILANAGIQFFQNITALSDEPENDIIGCRFISLSH